MCSLTVEDLVGECALRILIMGKSLLELSFVAWANRGEKRPIVSSLFCGSWGGGWGSFGDGFCIGIGFIGMQIDFVDEDNDVALLTGGSQVLLSFV